MQRIKGWVDEPREGVFYGRRVELETNHYDDAFHYQFQVRDWDTGGRGRGCSTEIERAWEMAIADMAEDEELKRKCAADAERHALERASSTERHPADSERDGRAAE